MPSNLATTLTTWLKLDCMKSAYDSFRAVVGGFGRRTNTIVTCRTTEEEKKRRREEGDVTINAVAN